MLTPKIFIKKNIAKILQSVNKIIIKFRLGEAYQHIHPYWKNLKIEFVNSGQHKVFYRKKYIFSCKSLSDLKNKNYTRMALFGAGPSIKYMNLSKIKNNEAVFVNGAIRLAEKIQAKPFMFMMMDRLFVSYYYELLPKLIKPNDNIFLSYGSLSMILSKDVNFLKDKNVYICANVFEPYFQKKRNIQNLDTKKTIIENKDNAVFSLDAEYGFYDGGSVITWAMQLAFYLRVKESFLLGVDLTNNNNVKHFYDETKKIFFTKASLDSNQINKFMKLAGKVFKEENLSIFNCSKNTLIPYEFIPYSDEFEQKNTVN